MTTGTASRTTGLVAQCASREATRFAAPRPARSARRSSPLRAIARALLVGLILLIVGTAAFYGARGFALYRDAAAATSLDDMAAAIRSTPGFTPIEELPDTYLDAVVATEDRRFFSHPGFDVLATARALANDVRAGAIVEGGSTITQQLAKNEFFTQEQSLERKVAEIFMAFDIEAKFDKDEILELYVNSIYFGDGYYGIGQAAQGYFGKDARDLDDCEATMLAGIPNAPSAYAPTESPELALQRQFRVIDAMVDAGTLERADAAAIEEDALRRSA